MVLSIDPSQPDQPDHPKDPEEDQDSAPLQPAVARLTWRRRRRGGRGRCRGVGGPRVAEVVQLLVVVDVVHNLTFWRLDWDQSLAWNSILNRADYRGEPGQF